MDSVALSHIAATRVDDIYELAGYGKTLVYLPLLVAAKGILLELRQLTSDHPHIGMNSSSFCISGALFRRYSKDSSAETIIELPKQPLVICKH